MHKRAFQFPEVRVVEASAGSGKTYTLAKRYVQLILNSAANACLAKNVGSRPQSSAALQECGEIPIRSILALTFTNKAAFEMKARILDLLRRLALGRLTPGEASDILGPLELDGSQATAKAFAAMDWLIRHYNFFQVQTIDKFINALLSGCAFKVGLTANFRIKTDFGEYLRRSLDRLIDKARWDKDVLGALEGFLHHYLYLENRSGWFPKDDMLTIMTSLFEQSNAYGCAFLQSLYATEDVVKKKRLIMDAILSLRQVLPVQTHAGFLKTLDKFLARPRKGLDVDSLSDYFAREDIPVRKGARVSAKALRLWSGVGRYIRELCYQEAHSLFDPYIGLFAKTMEEFHGLAAKDDCLFLSELNKRAGLLFDEDRVTVEELYYRLAARFHHYLIDEFQDTSRLQWHNLAAMVEEALSTGGTLFYVGDRKQAIYSFRGGDAGLFDEVQRSFYAFDVNTDRLTHNWRSQKEIVALNNMVFSMDNLKGFIAKKESYEREKNKKNAVRFSNEDMMEVGRIFDSAHQTAQTANDGGLVRMEYIDIDKKEERDGVIRAKLAILVRGLKERFAFRDIAVLTRGNQQVKDVTQWFLEDEIPVESERTCDISENACIRELIAFLTFLDSPIDNRAFAAFILGDIFSSATGLRTKDLHHFVFSLRGRLANEKDISLYAEFRSCYPQVWEKYMDEFFRAVGLYPLYELMVTIYGRFNVLENFSGVYGFFMHFLELIKKYETEHADIASFLEYFNRLQGEDLYVHVTDVDAVKVLTIHKAKGLEFPVVILPYLGMDIKIGASGGEYQPSYVLQPQEKGLGLVRMKTKYLQFSKELADLYSREYKKALCGELNNLYVAMTRPKYELYGLIPRRIGNSFNYAKLLIPQECYQRGGPRAYEASRPKEVSVLDVTPAAYPDWIDYLKDEFLDFNELKNRTRRLQGEAVHYALSRVGNLSGGSTRDVIARALDEARFRFLNPDVLGVNQEKLEALVDHPPIKPFFYCGPAKVFTEKETVSEAGQTRRCDRLVIGEKDAWVIDFKSTRDLQGRDYVQVQEYKKILSAIYPQKTIKGYLIYLDTLEVEETDGE